MPEPITDWLTNPTAQMVVEIDDGKAHAWVSVVTPDGSKRQRTEIDASKGAVKLAFVRDPDPATAAARADKLATDTGATTTFTLGPGEQIYVEQIHPEPCCSPEAAAKVAAVLTDPEATEEIKRRLAVNP